MNSRLDIRTNTPKPNRFYYKAYFAIGLLKYPRRALNLIKFILSNFNPHVSYYPIIIDFEPTQNCNYKCVMCVPFTIKRRDMTFDSFRKIIDEQFGLMEVKIQGVGEPLLNKDFFKMVDYAKKRWLWVRTTTNGSLLHVNDNYKRLVDSRIHDVNISIDGCTKDVYESIRRGGNFEQIRENCRLINDYNNRVKKTTIRAWVVLQKKNRHQLFNFPHFFADLGFKEMVLSFAMHNYGREGDNKETTNFTYSEDDFKKLMKASKKAGIKLSFFFRPYFDGNGFCQIPFKRVYITTDGHIIPCCYIANQEVVDFGSYKEFNRIWFKDYVQLRDNLKSRKGVPTFCKECYGGGNKL